MMVVVMMLMMMVMMMMMIMIMMVMVMVMVMIGRCGNEAPGGPEGRKWDPGPLRERAPKGPKERKWVPRPLLEGAPEYHRILSSGWKKATPLLPAAGREKGAPK